MAVKYTADQEHRNNQAARIGSIFDLPDAGMKISADGWTMTHTPESDSVRLTVELVAFISVEEAEKILNSTPVEEDGLRALLARHERLMQEGT